VAAEALDSQPVHAGKEVTIASESEPGIGRIARQAISEAPATARRTAGPDVLFFHLSLASSS